MRAFRNKPDPGGFSREDALSCTPTKNPRITEERLDSGDVVLVYPVVMRPWFARLTQRLGGPAPQTRTKRLQLDTLGTAVWELMDGKRTVREVIRQFAADHRLHPQEAKVSVTLFLRDLGKRGIVGLR